MDEFPQIIAGRRVVRVVRAVAWLIVLLALRGGHARAAAEADAPDRSAGAASDSARMSLRAQQMNVGAAQTNAEVASGPRLRPDGLDLRFRMATAWPAAAGGVGGAGRSHWLAGPGAHGGVRLSLLSLARVSPERGGGAGAPSTTASPPPDRPVWTPFGGGFRRYERSRVDCAMKGLGAGASLGLWLGALAQTTNAWDERTSWYVGGAAAVAGALLGGTVGVESERWRTGYDWEEK